MATQPIDYFGLMGGTQGLIDPGRAIAEGQARTQALQIQGQQAQAGALELDQAKQQQADDVAYQSDLHDVMLDPTPAKIAALTLRHPRYAKEIKQYHDLKNDDAQAADYQQASGAYNAANLGRYDIAAKVVRQRADAEKAAGKEDPALEAVATAFESGTDVEKKAALGYVGHYLASIDPDKFTKVYGKPDDEAYSLSAGQVRMKGDQVIAQSPYLQGADGAMYVRDDAPGTPAGNPSPAAAPGGSLDPKQFFKDFVLPHEGGLNPHDANGAPTKYGINQTANPGQDVHDLTPDTASDIFANKYFKASGAGNLPPALAAVHADTYFINPSRANQFLKASGGDPSKYLAMRDSWMRGLINNDPDKYGKYAHAWATRNADLGRYAAQVGGGTPAPSDPSGTAPSIAPDGAPPGFHTLIPGKGGGQILTGAQATAKGLDSSKNWWQPAGGGKPEAVGDATSSNLEGPAFLASLPVSRRNQLQAIADGRIAAPAPGSKYGSQLAEDAANAFPGIDTTTFPARLQTRKAFTGEGKGAQNISALNRFYAHLNDAYEIHLRLAGPNLGPLSGLAAGAAQSFSQKDVNDYNTAIEGLQGEFQKLTKNGQGNESEAERLITAAKAAQSSQGRLGALQALAKLAAAQVQPLHDQWSAAFPERHIPIDITPASRAIYQNVVTAGSHAIGVDGNGTPVVPSNYKTTHSADSTDPATIPVGAQPVGKHNGAIVYKLPNGRLWTP